MPKEIHLRAWVSVTIPVTLAYDTMPTEEEKRHDAMLNFMCHPAMQSKEEMDRYPSEITFEEELTAARTALEGGLITVSFQPAEFSL